MRKTFFITAVLCVSGLIPVFSQIEYHDNRKSEHDLNVEAMEYKIGRNNLVAGFSVTLDPTEEEGGGAPFVMVGIEKTFGRPEEGYFFAGEIRGRAGILWDKKSVLTGSLSREMKYRGNLAGVSVAVRPAMEISEKHFLYLEGELGLMYEYITIRIKGNNNNVIKRNSGGYIVPQSGVRLGVRSGKLSMFAGYYHFNHTNAVNRLVPKEYKVVNSHEGIGGELGFGFYF
ncbi:MAG: hypothetical protein LBS79_08385 [Tannerella sp.]|jgi:hypothetical protein|nr:hypothetical protein [Tannerella sp.]